MNRGELTLGKVATAKNVVDQQRHKIEKSRTKGCCAIVCCCCRFKRMADKIGERRIEKELDLVSFLKTQLMTRALFKVQFTKLERHFLKQNQQFVLPGPRNIANFDSSSSSSSDEEDLLEQYEKYWDESDGQTPETPEWNPDKDHPSLKKILARTFRTHTKEPKANQI